VTSAGTPAKICGMSFAGGFSIKIHFSEGGMIFTRDEFDRTFKRARDKAALGSDAKRSSGCEASPATPSGNINIKPKLARREPPSLVPDAYIGLAGEIVRVIEPHTESDPAYYFSICTS
jgi:hypothetical protein